MLSSMGKLSNKEYADIDKLARERAAQIAPPPRFDSFQGPFLAFVGAVLTIFLFCALMGIDNEHVQWQTIGAASIVATITFFIIRSGEKRNFATYHQIWIKMLNEAEAQTPPSE